MGSPRFYVCRCHWSYNAGYIITNLEPTSDAADLGTRTEAWQIDLIASFVANFVSICRFVRSIRTLRFRKSASSASTPLFRVAAELFPTAGSRWLVSG